MAKKIRIRRDSATNWFTTNPILGQGELGFETDTVKLKIGDGVSNWNTLNYFGYYPTSFGDLTSSDNILNITGGTGCVLGSGVSLSVDVASSTTSGYLTSTDWNVFNSKYSGLPSQSGKVGKFLYSDGTTESWEDAPVDASASLNKAFVVAMSVAMSL